MIKVELYLRHKDKSMYLAGSDFDLNDVSKVKERIKMLMQVGDIQIIGSRVINFADVVGAYVYITSTTGGVIPKL